MSNVQPPDAGLVRRGLFLLAGLFALVVIVLWIIFQRPEQTKPAPGAAPEPVIAALVMSPDGGFPVSVAWAALAELPGQLPSAPGWEVRYNAAASLGRLGSEHVPWAVLAEMLDEQQQMRNFRVRLDSGEIVPDEAAARLTVVAGLKAVKQWHEKSKTKRSAADWERVNTCVGTLTASPIVELKMQAEETRRAMVAWAANRPDTTPSR